MPKRKSRQPEARVVGVSTTISERSDAFYEEIAQKEDRSKAAILRRVLERHASRHGRKVAAA